MTENQFNDLLEKNLKVAEQKGFSPEDIGGFLSDATMSRMFMSNMMGRPDRYMQSKKIHAKRILRQVLPDADKIIEWEDKFLNG